MLNSQAQGGDKSRQTHQSLQRVLELGTFIQGSLERTCSGWDVKARGQVGLIERLLCSLYTLGLVLLSKLLRNYRSKLADEGLTRLSLLLAYLRTAD